ncbi:hypothetical protein ACL9RL_18410 [Plantibacter sp. Mn2098]|uniref:AbiTii domain-containing protein n=1 Tax=Plantibacter sp. Mn2098 TaxID=3395266 RepID=UPI003BE471DF
MTYLDEIIDGSTDSSVTVTNLLRKVQIVATRVGAPEIVAWVKGELGGYTDPSVDLPPYRILNTSVTGLFTGYGGSQVKQSLPHHKKFKKWFVVELRQPLREIESFAEGDFDPSRDWPDPVVQAYEQTGTYGIEDHSLFNASNVLTRQSLGGIIDMIRTKAMEFALELQAQSPDAGTLGGPTVSSDTGMAQTVFNITNNITGHGTNIAAGTDIQQHSTVQAGNLESLREFAESLGLPTQDAQDFAAAVKSDQSIEGTRVKAFLDRVRAGTVSITSKVTTGVIVAQLVEAGKQFLGLS